LLASLKEKSTHGELNCFLGAEDKSLDEATRDVFALFTKIVALPAVEALPYF